jgi:hypothetical protein
MAHHRLGVGEALTSMHGMVNDIHAAPALGGD